MFKKWFLQETKAPPLPRPSDIRITRRLMRSLVDNIQLSAIRAHNSHINTTSLEALAVLWLAPLHHSVPGAQELKRYAHGSKADISIGDFHVLVFGDCSLSAFLFPLFSRTLVRFCFNLFLVSCVCYSNLVRGISLDLLFSFFFFILRPCREICQD